MTRHVACALFILTLAAPAAAQNHAVRVEKIATPEKMLRVEVTVPATVDEVWKAFTTREGVTTWLWSDARIEFEARRRLARDLPWQHRRRHHRQRGTAEAPRDLGARAGEISNRAQ